MQKNPKPLSTTTTPSSRTAEKGREKAGPCPRPWAPQHMLNSRQILQAVSVHLHSVHHFIGIDPRPHGCGHPALLTQLATSKSYAVSVPPWPRGPLRPRRCSVKKQHVIGPGRGSHPQLLNLFSPKTRPNYGTSLFWPFKDETGSEGVQNCGGERVQ